LKNVFQSSKAALPVLDDGGGIARRPAELLKLRLRDVMMNCEFVVGFVSLLNDIRVVVRVKLLIEGFCVDAEHFVENWLTLRLKACGGVAAVDDPVKWNGVKQQEKREPPDSMTLRMGALATEACIVLN
jgi:hypothetical protein